MEKHFDRCAIFHTHTHTDVFRNGRFRKVQENVVDVICSKFGEWSQSGACPGFTSLGQIRKTEHQFFLNKLTRFEFNYNLREILLRLNEKNEDQFFRHFILFCDLRKKDLALFGEKLVIRSLCDSPYLYHEPWRGLRCLRVFPTEYYYII